MASNESLRESFRELPLIFKIREFAASTSMLREIARLQLLIDKGFRKDLFALKGKLYRKKIKPQKFWDDYKKALAKSVSKDNKLVQVLIKKADKDIKRRFKEAEKTLEEKGPEEPLLDLSLPA